MDMFCYQCQETAKGVGCTKVGVCGKTSEVSYYQDLTIYLVKGISNIIINENLDYDKDLSFEIMNSLFMTITNANFDKDAIEEQINKLVIIRDSLAKDSKTKDLHHSAIFRVEDLDTADDLVKKIGVLSIENEDERSLKELVIYGLKGLAAYYIHAYNLGYEDEDICKFTYHALNETLKLNLSIEELLSLVVKTGEYGVKVMALLDKANTEVYGNPEMTNVEIGVRNNPAILISGHDLKDLEMLLEQTKGTGVDVYTHGEMLPAHYYPKFKKYDNLFGNYGNAWWKQLEEFKSFNGPILFTTNCIVPPRDEEIRQRIFTTGASGYPGCTHILEDENGFKDFSEIIAMAKSLKSPLEIENGQIIGGFAHNQVFELADKVVEAVKNGDIKKFVVMAGCDGRMKSREYYTEFAEKLPNDTVILTAGCAKYRYNKLDLKDINGIPRVLDAGQCNDSYSLALIALKLKEIFELEDINELPIVYNIAWYEQKAVIVLLSLLSLGVKNIYLGPTLPAFLSDNVIDVLIDLFKLGTISSVDKDLEFMI